MTLDHLARAGLDATLRLRTKNEATARRYPVTDEERRFARGVVEALVTHLEEWCADRNPALDTGTTRDGIEAVNEELRELRGVVR